MEMVVKIACIKGGGILLHCAPNRMQAEIKGDEKLLIDLEGPKYWAMAHALMVYTRPFLLSLLHKGPGHTRLCTCIIYRTFHNKLVDACECSGLRKLISKILYSRQLGKH